MMNGDDIKWDNTSVARFPEGRAMTPEQKVLIALLKEARSIIRASSSRQLAKDWDIRTTQALKDAT